MSVEFCEHLEMYEVQYQRTLASYRHCIGLMDRMLAEGQDEGFKDLMDGSLDDWREEDRRLREMLVDLVKDEEVVLPRKHLELPGWARTEHRDPVTCGTCGLPVPRLEYEEWEFPATGPATFRGEELPVPEPV